MGSRQDWILELEEGRDDPKPFTRRSGAALR